MYKMSELDVKVYVLMLCCKVITNNVRTVYVCTVMRKICRTLLKACTSKQREKNSYGIYVREIKEGNRKRSE